MEELEWMKGKTVVVKPSYGGRPPVPIEQRFWAKVNPIPDERGCKIWIGGKSIHPKSGTTVGHIFYEGKTANAHVVMWILEKGVRSSRQIQPIMCKNYLCMTIEHWRETMGRVFTKTAEQIREDAKAMRELDKKESEKFHRKAARKAATRERNREKNRRKREGLPQMKVGEGYEASPETQEYMRRLREREGRD